MQSDFSYTPHVLGEIFYYLSQSRFQKYMAYADRDKQLAIHLYRWNVELSESLYWPLQTVEIAFRNAIAATLRDRFGAGWHLNGHFHRILAEEHRLKLRQAVARQKRKRKSERPTEDAVIADMPFGFWTSLLTARYDVPLKWNHNIRRSFPHIPRGCSRGTIAGSADRIRDIRNRIAHHDADPASQARPQIRGD